MSNTFLTWLLAAALAGLGLFFLLGTPDAALAGGSASGSLTTNGAGPVPEAAYWQNVTPAAAPVASSAGTSTTLATPCASCSTTVASAAATLTAAAILLPAPLTAPVSLAGGCGSPAVPCGRGSCGAVKTCPVVAPQTAVEACGSVGCGHTVCAACGRSECDRSPCAHAPNADCGCESCACPCAACAVDSCEMKPHCAVCPETACEAKPGCAVPLCSDHPRINRNSASCVDECSFIQLYSIVPMSLCESSRFLWAATRGRFIDPHSPAPIYYAPATGLPGGEDVLITLTVTDVQGNEYSDQLKLHVNSAD